MLRYFAYGANIDPDRMSTRVPEAVVVGPGHVERFGVEFTIRDREWGGGVLNAREDPDSVLWGLLYEGPDEAFAVLDTFVGDSALMEKAEVTVVTSAGPVEAFTYRVIPIANYVRPSDRYLTHLSRAMTAQGLPPEALAAVLAADRDAGETQGPSIVS
jgi:hypothetical protein